MGKINSSVFKDASDPGSIQRTQNATELVLSKGVEWVLLDHRFWQMLNPSIFLSTL